MYMLQNPGKLISWPTKIVYKKARAKGATSHRQQRPVPRKKLGRKNKKGIEECQLSRKEQTTKWRGQVPQLPLCSVKCKISE